MVMRLCGICHARAHPCPDIHNLPPNPAQGFQRVADALARDVPATRQRLEEAAREAAAAGWLDPGFADAQSAAARAPGSANGVPAVPPEVKVKCPNLRVMQKGKVKQNKKLKQWYA